MTDGFYNEMVGQEQLPKLEEIEYLPISKSYLWVMLFRTLLRFALIFFLYFMTAYTFRSSLDLYVRQGVPMLLMGWFLFSLFRVYQLHKKKAYALRTHDVHYKSGWLWKRLTTIPYCRIQHCELTSGPMEKIFDLATLHIFTAGGSNSDLSIEGLTTLQGGQIKKFILTKLAEDEEE